MAIRNVLITGGNSGIGFSACKLFASQPNYHCILTSRDAAKGKEAVATIKSANPAAAISFVQLDITSDDSITAASKQVAEQYGHLDVLINNAGYAAMEFSRNALRDCINTNAISPALVTQALAPLLEKSNDIPRIIYVSSGLGSITQRSDPSSSAYTLAAKTYRTSKAALNMLAACDAFEYKGKIKVFAFCPGRVSSNLSGRREEEEKAGMASPDTSARAMLLVAEGKRDAENGLFIHDEEFGEVYPW